MAKYGKILRMKTYRIWDILTETLKPMGKNWKFQSLEVFPWQIINKISKTSYTFRTYFSNLKS